MKTVLLNWLRDTSWQSVGLASAFCPIYVLCAAVYCYLWLTFVQKYRTRDTWLFVRRLWQNHRRSMAVDGVWVLGQLVILRLPLAWVHLRCFEFFYETTLEQTIPFSGEGPEWIEAGLATLFTMLAIDLAAYLVHRGMHRFSLLWKIHRIHHSAKFLTPLSTFRQNPLEPFLLTSARGMAAGLALGGLHLLFPNAAPVWTVGGMGVGFFLYMFTVNLHHAPIPVRYPRVLRVFLISPHVHHIHHSLASEHFDKNFGVVFSIWDRWFGSYLEQDLELDELQFGLKT